MSRPRQREIAAIVTDLLLWLALPLLLLPFLVERERIGAASSQLIITGVGLGALVQGAGTLDPRDLRDVAARSPHAAWFIGITLGLLLGGACLSVGVRSWRAAIAAAPLAVGVALSLASGAVGTAVAGILIGLVPASVGRVLPGASGPAADETRPAVRASELAVQAILGGLAIAVALAGPAWLAAALLAAVPWSGWWSTRAAHGLRSVPVLAALACLILAAWLWFALTIAGTPFASFARLATDAPVSSAASVWLAILALAWGTALAAPWPLDRLADLRVQLPVTAVVLYLAAGVAPDGMMHWQPLLSIVMVLVALVATLRRRWDGAVGALMLLGATRTGSTALIAALGVAFIPMLRRIPGTTRFVRALGASSVALLVAIMLRDQVVMGTVLGLGLASIASRRMIVARVADSQHL
ncbi:MAG: hypothetical protein ACREK8_02010 [Gemmatimonadales bacterium]